MLQSMSDALQNFQSLQYFVKKNYDDLTTEVANEI